MHTRCQLAPAAVAALLLIAPAAGGAELRGTVQLAKGERGAPSRELRHAQIYFEPAAPAPLAEPAEPVEIATVRKAFTPRVRTVPVGTTIRFPNQDSILHNVFSVSGENRFDLGLYRRGEGKAVTFEHPGVVRVFCNVHHSMVAYVLVVETPFATTPEEDGSFRLAGLPAGPGTLTVWHERAEPVRRDVVLPLAEPVTVEIAITKKRVPRHTNKFGKPYQRRRGGRVYH